MSIKSVLEKIILGSDGGLKFSDLIDLSERTKLSDSLPWIYYNDDESCFLNVDGSIGVGWECSPLAFAGDQTVNILKGIFRAGIPEGSVLQFILHADDNIDPLIQSFKENKNKRNNDLVKGIGENLGEFFRSSVAGFKMLGGIPSRNFRLFVYLKIPDSKGLSKSVMGEIVNAVYECLAGANLGPDKVTGKRLVDWARRILNDIPSQNNSRYDPLYPIRKQIIFAETEVEDYSDSLRIGSRHFRCITPKVFPKDVDLFQTNQLFGGVWGLISDNDQIKLPFIYSLNIVFENMKAGLHTKCNLVLQQKAVGSFGITLRRKQEEYLWATDKLEGGEQFVRVIPTLWIYGKDKNRVSETVSRAKRMWESAGYVMQDDRGILRLLLLSSLPFGLINKGDNVDNIDRDFIVPADTVTSILPIQGDFSGSSSPALMVVGRKGQIAFVDVFAPGANNHNMFICASSGGGKSFLVNYIVSAYYGAGAKIRIIDIGGSYKKTTSMFDAKYLHFSPESDVCVNPFSNITDPEFDIPMVATIIAQMCYSGDITASPTATEKTILERTVTYVYKNAAAKGWKMNIDAVHEILLNAKDYVDAEVITPETIANARELAFNLQKFTSEGPYGRFFNRDSSLDISKDDFVVLELEHLAQNPALFSVITLQVVNLVTQNLYLSDRGTPIFIIFDEAHQFLRESGIISLAIETGYRRARKYGGSFSIITQSVLDLKKFGNVGEVIYGNSAFKFYLESTDFVKAKKENIIHYDDFIIDLLNSVKSNPPKYSEIFFDTPSGKGVGRLLVDMFTYYAFTSKGSEIAEIEAKVKEGMSYEEAIMYMVEKYRK
ncbi:MAG: TraC family protein [Nitrospinota bacterium]|nr:TraC family protein [Nitrospinota bacterium]